MIHLKKVVSLPEVLQPNTIYLHRDALDGLMITVSDHLGSVAHSTKSTIEIFNMVKDYTDAEISKLKLQLQGVFQSIDVIAASSWGDSVYVLQVLGEEWRVKRVDGAGVVLYSNSTDTVNLGIAKETAWLNRAELVYA